MTIMLHMSPSLTVHSALFSPHSKWLPLTADHVYSVASCWSMLLFLPQILALVLLLLLLLLLLVFARVH